MQKCRETFRMMDLWDNLLQIRAPCSFAYLAPALINLTETPACLNSFFMKRHTIDHTGLSSTRLNTFEFSSRTKCTRGETEHHPTALSFSKATILVGWSFDSSFLRPFYCPHLSGFRIPIASTARTYTNVRRRHLSVRIVLQTFSSCPVSIPETAWLRYVSLEQSFLF